MPRASLVKAAVCKTAFARFDPEAALRGVIKTVKATDGELWTYQEAIACDDQLMRALEEFVPDKQFYVVIEKSNPDHRYVAHYRKADLRGAILRYSQRFVFRGPYPTHQEAEAAMAKASAPEAETPQWAMPELSLAKQRFKRGVMPSVESTDSP